MKFSSQETYGLRCLIQVACQPKGTSITIPEISEAEGLSTANAAKLLRLLRKDGFIISHRGQNGGYVLAKPPEDIYIREVLDALGGRLLRDNFCEHYKGIESKCKHLEECAIRSLWDILQNAVDDALEGMTLKQLIESECDDKPLKNNHQLFENMKQ